MILIIPLLLLANPGHTAQPHGGMLYHIGHLSLSTPSGTVQGFATGLGGRLAFPVLPRLRLGGYGFSSEANPKPHGTHLRVSAGGVIAESPIPIGRLHLSPGLFLGIGNGRSLRILGTNPDGTVTASLHRFAPMAFAAPYILAELPLRGRLRLAIMADGLFAYPTSESPSLGPRLHLGGLFSR